MRLGGLTDWLDSRTGFRSGRKHLLDEPLPSGVGWWFVTGSILLFLLGVQVITGIVLTMYYVPSPEHAYDSVRFIMEQLTFGSILRGLHFFGASFIVVAAVVHMLRVVLFGSYKQPREVTWITGVVLLLIILAFSLSGYLLPWDQKAYWATIVTVNIARSGPFGEYVGGLLTGSDALGALTLLRWYSAHVFLLPAALAGFVVAHLYLMRRHGISGPVTPVPGPELPFYPYHAIKDTIAMAVVFSLLLTFAVMVPAPLDDIADPTDDSYIPRPEWYFLSLFQLLRYFPGPFEPIATVVIPGLVVGLLLALPFLDRGPDRHAMKRPLIMAAFGVLGVGIVSLTYLGLKDSAAHADPSHWSPLAIAGREFAQDKRCAACHVPGGAANPIADTRLSRDPEWLLSHVRDPEVIAPGLRTPPPGGMNVAQAQSILAYMRQIRASPAPPSATREEHEASVVIGRYCVSCHMIDGEGASSAPDLTRAGAERDADWLRGWISEPESVDPFANMPAFGGVLTDEQMTALVNYLAARK
jgi:ubiquinol-cytochrome c reductase cytochrome b subunit